jgi:hypothetical protein
MIKTLNGVNTHTLAHIVELIFDVFSDVAIILLAAT